MKKRRTEHSPACRRSSSACVCEFSDVFADAPSHAPIGARIRSVFRRDSDRTIPGLPSFDDVVPSPDDNTPKPVDIDLTSTPEETSSPEEQSQDLPRPLEAG